MFFGQDDKPQIGAFLVGDKIKTVPLYLPNTGVSIYDIEQSKRLCSKLVERALLNGTPFITSDFKLWLHEFDLPLPREQLPVYDLMLPESLTKARPKDLETAEAILAKILRSISQVKQTAWQQAIANSAVVYEFFQRRGVLVGHLPQETVWSQRVFSGRSKTLGFNIHGATDKDLIQDPQAFRDDLLVHFDWRAADIRIVAVLSGDEHLNTITLDEDPYNHVAKLLDIERDEAKVLLLSIINSLRYDDKVLDLFPDVRTWMITSLQKLRETGTLCNLLGRKFSLSEDRTDKSVFNAVMQGSIAQAMQLSIAKIWQSTDIRLLAEIHDSIVITCQRSKLAEAMQVVTDIMCRPFAGLLDSNPAFPVRVSIGKSWKNWKPIRLYTDSGQYQTIST